MDAQSAATFTYDVCLSFAGADRPAVQPVAAALRAAGLRVFYDEYERADLLGRDLYAHLDWVYRCAARYCLMFLSAEYARRLWTNHERKSAQARALTQSGEYILPARLDDTEVPGMLPTLAYFDLRTGSAEELVRLVLAKLDAVPRAAVLIDGDWLLAVAPTLDTAGLLRRLRAAFGAEAAVQFHLSVTGTRQASRARDLTAAGYDVRLAHVRAGKSNGDQRLNQAAALLPARHRSLVLVSGDADMVPLLLQAKAAGRAALLVTRRDRVAPDLPAAADEILDLEPFLSPT